MICETAMALSSNGAGGEVDGATRSVHGGNRDDDLVFFDWLQAQLALSNALELQEGQGSNDITPEGSVVMSNPESEGSNNITVTSDHRMVDDPNHASAISQGHHAEGSNTRALLNGDLPADIPVDHFSCDCDEDDDDDWIVEVVESGILDIHERGR